MPVAALSPLERSRGSGSRSADSAGGRPELVAAVMAALPWHLWDRLEADPALTARWRWSLAGARLAVEAAPEAVVTLSAAGVMASRDEIACACLLAPRCLQLAAVLRALPTAAPSTSGLRPRRQTRGGALGRAAADAAALQTCDRGP
jgi:hypothetical protein